MRAGVAYGLCAIVGVLLVASACVSPPETAQPAPSPEAKEPSDAGTTPMPGQELKILRLEPSAMYVNPGGHVWITCAVYDPTDGPLRYEWGATGGSFLTLAGRSMTWIAPDSIGDWAVTVTVRNSEGHIAKETTVLTVIENRPPVIIHLEAEHPVITIGGSTTVACVAKDPDGDTLSYQWRADGGTLTGVGNTVTWFAPYTTPDHKTEFLITVVVDDGKGGLDLREITIKVDVPYTTEVFTPLLLESGTVRSDSVKYDDMSRAGDDSNNKGYRALWSYDFYRLRGTRIVNATLRFQTAFIHASYDVVINGQPDHKLWKQLRGLRIYQVRYPPNELPGYDPQRVLELTDSALFVEPTEIDVTEYIDRIAKGMAASDRFQVMAAFTADTNPNMFAEYIDWTSVTIHVTYTPN